MSTLPGMTYVGMRVLTTCGSRPTNNDGDNRASNNVETCLPLGMSKNVDILVMSAMSSTCGHASLISRHCQNTDSVNDPSVLNASTTTTTSCAHITAVMGASTACHSID